MALSRLSESDARRCWICFATDDDEPAADWVRPCNCCGTTKWVHQVCLQRWIDERQAGNSTTKVSCPQCDTQYIIIFPSLGIFLQAVEDMDKFINKVCPPAAASVLVGSLYWSSVTYGAVTIMQVLGHKEGLDVMEKADPLFLLVGLPTIPLILIMGKMINWEDHLLRIWRRHVSKMSLLSFIIPRLSEPVTGVRLREPAEPTPMSNLISATRILCGALIMPTVATLIGKVAFPFVQSSLNRAVLLEAGEAKAGEASFVEMYYCHIGLLLLGFHLLLDLLCDVDANCIATPQKALWCEVRGGVLFISVKGAIRIYNKQQQYMRQAQRVVKDYPED